MPKTYLPKRIHGIFLFIFLLLIFFGEFKNAFFLVLIYLSAIFLFRKNTKPLYREINSSKGLVFSPVFGEVSSIRQNINHKVFGNNLIEIRFHIPFFSEMGIYLPVQGEIKDLRNKWGTVIYRYGEIPDQENEVLNVPQLEIRNKNNELIGMQFVECSLGLTPHFYILPGDKGLALANFGYFPFGGTVLLYLPGNYEILVKENTKVSPKDVLIARSRV